MGYDIFLVGVGGQGVLTVAELIAEAAVLHGLPVHLYPYKGMAQRGGFVKAQVRLGRERAGPNIPQQGADLVIGMEVSEALKGIRFLKPGGDFLLYGHVWPPTAVMLGKADYPPLADVLEAAQQAGARVVYLDPAQRPLYGDEPVPANVYVLGAAVGQTRLGEVMGAGVVLQAVEARWPKGVERNRFAFRAGLGGGIG